MTMSETRVFAKAYKRKQQSSNNRPVPNKYLLQWHIIDNCNLTCRHCYQENHVQNELSLKALIHIYRQFSGFLASTGEKTHGHINLTGGEPFLNENLMDLLELLYDDSHLSYAILTNGTLIDADMAKRLKKLKPSFVQVSIDGARKTHDQIRGQGTHQKALKGIANLVETDIPVYISFTAHRNNYQDFPDVVKLSRSLGVSRIWADRLIPCGNASDLTNNLLNTEETQAFFEMMQSSRKKKWPLIEDEKDVIMHRALQFLVGGGEPYHCKAGDTLITILPNGDVLPCRRMPVVVGNVFDRTLSEIYRGNSFLKSLRDKNITSKGCEQCFYKAMCRGGLRCLSHAIKGDPFYADPGCWLSSNQQEQKETKSNEWSL